MPMSMASFTSFLFVKNAQDIYLLRLHEGLLGVPTPFIGAVPSSLIQCNSRSLR